MAWTKVWNSTSDGDYKTASNWKPTSVCNSAYGWTLSATGSGIYYLRTAGGANPGFVNVPAFVLVDGAEAVFNSAVNDLNPGEWAFGNDDSLGYNTLYIRLDDETDPDGKPVDFVEFQQIPTTGDHVRVPPNTASIDGSDNLAVVLASFIVEEGYAGELGSSSEWLRINSVIYEHHGLGTSYVDLGTTAVSPQIHATASPNPGERGLYLIGTGISLCNVIDGNVGIASRGGEAAAVATLRVVNPSASVVVGKGCALTAFQQYNGRSILRCSATLGSGLQYAGTVISQETIPITAFTQYGGEFVPNSTGTLATHNHYGGLIDFLQSGAARAVTNFNYYAGDIRLNAEAVSIANFNRMQSGDMSFNALAG